MGHEQTSLSPADARVLTRTAIGAGSSSSFSSSSSSLTSSSSSPLLPSHRFFSTSTLKASPFYAIPVHYLRRKGVLMVLLCMGVIAYIHYQFLMPSPSSSLFGVGGRMGGRGGDLKSRGKSGSGTNGDEALDYSKLDLGDIRERPPVGPAPVDGVDEDGFEILEEDRVRMMDLPDPASESKQQIIGPSRRPTIQFNADPSKEGIINLSGGLERDRQQFVKGMIQHAWAGYVQHAAPHDELKSVTGDKMDPLHGWGTTLLESLDTLKLVGLESEYLAAKEMFLKQVPVHNWGVGDSQDRKEGSIDAEASGQDIGFFESVVRYLGGLLSIRELESKDKNLKDDPRILQSAVDLSNRLVMAFQGVNGALPASRIFANGTLGSNEVLFGKTSLAEVGTFQLEFRKLAQLANDEKYSTLAQRNADFLSSLKPKIPGLYPAYFDPEAGVGQEYVASFGSLSDSFYEYLLKSYMLTNDDKFKDQYIVAVDAMHQYLISRPSKKSEPYLVLGVYNTATRTLVPKMDHLSCFAPGLLALGSRVLDRSKDLAVARGLMETCVLSYKNSATGLGADEIAFLVSGGGHDEKIGTGTTDILNKGKEFEMPQPTGFYVLDSEYELRPETVESLFIMYRVTGETKYRDYAWAIAQSIEKNCKTKYGYSTLANVMDISEGMTDRMPSHFLAQTLKYLYLIFSPPDLASLDEFLFTTEGHMMSYPIPFKDA
ncbi:hypothetical protein EMPS_00525 [Entomortierella parvispora]|uniref:alpha-1,2-Mannosidase n=1 Tax=Entomortierella parvispora TaxID=205924 RepID=A0A9P3H154_9FUNG|nr:hypothetical protein EMPS_00525 [Entomortierella parvispora]